MNLINRIFGIDEQVDNKVRDIINQTPFNRMPLEEFENRVTCIAINIANEAITKLLNPTIEIVCDGDAPTYATPGDAGADIKANLWNIQEKFLTNAEVIRREDNTIESIVIHPNGHCLVPTGIYTSFPDMYEVQIRPRSGLALKFRITVTNSPGTIDAPYRNEWGIILDNEGSEDFVIKHGDRIAQMVITLKCKANFIKKETVKELSGSNRGGGFGHTGK